MKILFNGLLIEKGMTGTGYYAVWLLEHMLRRDEDHVFQVLVREDMREELAGRISSPKAELVPCPVRGGFSRIRFEQLYVPGLMERLGTDLYHGPNVTAILRSSRPQVITLHDMIHDLMPETFPWVKRLYFRLFYDRYLAKARRIITVSRTTRDDLARLRPGFPIGKVDVVHVAPTVYPELASGQIRPEILECSRKPYLFAVGSVEKRKNLFNLVKAYECFALQEGPEAPNLLLVGKRHFGGHEVMGFIARSSVRDRIRFTGYVSDAEMAYLYGHSVALLFPSLYEGFGSPVVDAQLSGVPVITSGHSSLPEVAGDGALFVNPADPDSIAVAIFSLWKDAGLRRRLVEAGRRNVSKFSWDETARLTLESYSKALAPYGSE